MATPFEPAPLRIAYIRTSDRGTFKSCRRKWNWSSPLRENRGSRETASPLWLGSGFHFALEDFHGYRHFDRAADALYAFYEACRRTSGLNLPDDYKELLELGKSMLDYYQDYWLLTRDPLQTYWHPNEDGILVPQVEVEASFEIPMDPDLLNQYGYDKAIYQVHFDRVAVDRDGELWIVEYKTAKQYEWYHLETDLQVSSYSWAGTAVYDKPCRGVIYQQHKKVIPDEPRMLANGRYSTASNMITSHSMYRKALINLYTSVEKAPTTNVEFLNKLAEQETEDRDAYVQRQIATRNQHQVEAEGTKVLLEAEEMLNPDIALYPHPTRNCSWCTFLSPCLALDDGGDWNFHLDDISKRRIGGYDSWRPALQLPSRVQQHQQLLEPEFQVPTM